MVILWDWELGRTKLSFHSGHTNNVLDAKFMPYKDEWKLVICAADGEVRMALLQDGGHVFTSVLARHKGRAHKMAVEPGNPHVLYSCGKDGLVHHIDLRSPTAATLLFKCKTFERVRLNAITIDPRNPNHCVIVGSDKFARVYDICECRWDGKTCDKPAYLFCPAHLIGDDQSGIIGLAFSDQSELLASYNFESIYLFSKDQRLGNTVQEYKWHANSATVKGVSFFGPNYEYVTSGSDCGRAFIWKKNGGELLRVMEGDKVAIN